MKTKATPCCLRMSFGYFDIITESPIIHRKPAEQSTAQRALFFRKGSLLGSYRSIPSQRHHAITGYKAKSKKKNVFLFH